MSRHQVHCQNDTCAERAINVMHVPVDWWNDVGLWARDLCKFFFIQFFYLFWFIIFSLQKIDLIIDWLIFLPTIFWFFWFISQKIELVVDWLITGGNNLNQMAAKQKSESNILHLWANRKSSQPEDELDSIKDLDTVKSAAATKI
jgi:hypothetical protein